MTENTATTADETDIAIALHANLRPGNGDTIALRQVALGYQPLVLIEIDLEASEEETMVVKLDTTSFAPNELSAFLRTVADVVDQATEAGALTMNEPDEDEDEDPSED